MRAMGYIATSATTEAAVNATAYAEQSAGAQRAIKSSSANDAAAGTGVRKVKITYFTLAADGTIAGPFFEIVTLNGTNAVATVATNIALIDRIEAVAVGSGGVAAGSVLLTVNADGTGGTIAGIATGDRRTHMAHMYVPSGRRLTITDLILASGEAATVNTLFELRALAYPSSNNPVDIPLTGKIALLGLGGAQQYQLSIPVQGPARVQLYCTPGAATATTQRGEFGASLN